MHDATRLSDLKLERFALGELPAEEMESIQSRLEVDPELLERLQMLRKSTAAILQESPPPEFARRLQASARRRAVEESLRDGRPEFFAANKPLLRGAAVLALVALIAIPVSLFQSRPAQVLSDAAIGTQAEGTIASPENLSVPGDPYAHAPSQAQAPSQPSTNPPSAGPALNPGAAAPATPSDPGAVAAAPNDGVRLKGLEPHLAIFRKTAKGAEPLRPGEKARAGELLRIGYQAAGFPYGAILSVDGNGSVTRHWPKSGDRAGKLENGDALLPSSFELDAAPDFERFFLVVSTQPFDLDPLVKALHQNESLPTSGKKLHVVGFEILKESGI